MSKYVIDEWNKTSLARRIRWHRERCGLSQFELAMRAGTSQSAIGRYERGVEEQIRVTTLRRIAKALGVSCGELLD